jgi:O-antigen ligase
VWRAGIDVFQDSPLIGFGFHADRLVLGTHMHNSIMQALVQTGLLGTIAFVAAILFGWFQILRIIRNLDRLPPAYKHLTIQTGAVLAFLSLRSFPESTGAFFGVDWLILAPILLFLGVLGRSAPAEVENEE